MTLRTTFPEVTPNSSGRDRVGIAALLRGFILLAATVAGAWFQRPQAAPEPVSAASWLFRPQEQNAF
ncbi:MAG: hypothetical protein ABJC09_17360 [Terriglobia bacterium]